MRSLSRATQIYLIALWCCGLVALATSFLNTRFSLELLALLLVCVPIFVFADYHDISFEVAPGNNASMTVSEAPLFFLVAVTGPAGMWTAVIGSVIADASHRRPWYKVLFNAASRAVTYYVLVLIYNAFIPPGSTPFDGLVGLLAFAVMALSYHTVNSLLVVTVLGLATNRPFVSVLHDTYRRFHWVHFATMPFGALAAVVWYVSPWLVILCVLPLLLLRRWFHTLAELQLESRRNESLARESRQLADRLERMQSAATAMIATTDPDVLLATVSGHLAAVLEADAHWVVLRDGGPRLVGGASLPAGWAWEPRAYAEELAQPGVRVLDAAASRRLHRMDQVPWQSLLMIPLTLEARTLGAIFLAVPRAVVLAGDDQRVLLAFAAQAALAAERARLFAELRTKQDELIRSSKLAALGTFAAGIGHEFNNLLAGLLGFAQLALASDDVHEKNEALEVAVRLCLRGRSITGGLLTFARRHDAQRVPYLIGMVVEETLALVERELAKENIRVVRQLEPVPETLCDPGQIAQVIVNLINNARDAMRDQGGGTLTISLAQRGDQIELAISDTGHGIPENLVDQIFQPFVTTKGALNGSATPGTGLGLAISLGIVEGHGGTMEARSQEGMGTTMIVRLPIIVPARATESAPAKHDVPHLRILLVDDEPDVGEALARLLESHDQHVTLVGSADQALSAYREQPFDLVISDIVMPGISGIELVRKLRAHDPHAAFLVISGYGTLEQTNDLLAAGVREVLRKPFTLTELLEAIERCAQDLGRSTLNAAR